MNVLSYIIFIKIIKDQLGNNQKTRESLNINVLNYDFWYH